MYLSKHRLEDIVEDERIHQINQKASGITLQFIALSFAIGGDSPCSNEGYLTQIYRYWFFHVICNLRDSCALLYLLYVF